jgi:hypothetical protein
MNQSTTNQGWLTLGLLAAGGAAGAFAYKKNPAVGMMAGMLAVVLVRKPLKWV